MADPFNSSSSWLNCKVHTSNELNILAQDYEYYLDSQDYEAGLVMRKADCAR